MANTIKINKDCQPNYAEKMKVIRKFVNFNIDLRKRKNDKNFSRSEKSKISRNYNEIVKLNHLRFIPLRKKRNQSETSYNRDIKKFKGNYNQSGNNLKGSFVNFPFKHYRVDKNFNVRSVKKEIKGGNEYVIAPFPELFLKRSKEFFKKPENKNKKWDLNQSTKENVLKILTPQIKKIIKSYDTKYWPVLSIRLGLNLGLSGDTYIWDASQADEIIKEMLDKIIWIIEKYEVDPEEVGQNILIKRGVYDAD